MERYRVPGVTDFGPDFIDSPGKRVEALPHLDLGTSNQIRFASALQRDLRHAVGNPTSGLDGTNYFFSYEDDQCAVVWSPDRGAAKALVTIVDELTLPKPSVEVVEAGLDRLERIRKRALRALRVFENKRGIAMPVHGSLLF